MRINNSGVLLTFILLIGMTMGCKRGGSPNTKSGISVQKTPHSVENRNPKTRGQILYEQNCLSCHQTDGTGVPGMIPPLKNSDWVVGNPDKLISVILNGIKGPIIVSGENYDQEMPPQDYLEDQEILEILNYTRYKFGGKATPIKIEQIEALRTPHP